MLSSNSLRQASESGVISNFPISFLGRNNRGDLNLTSKLVSNIRVSGSENTMDSLNSGCSVPVIVVVFCFSNGFPSLSRILTVIYEAVKKKVERVWNGYKKYQGIMEIQ